VADPLDRLPEFFAEVQTRLLAGRRAYGDKSFSKDPRELLAEVEQELFDVCGWSYCLYVRLAAMRQALRDVEPSYQVANGEPTAHDTVPAPANCTDVPPRQADPCTAGK
jgi:hypothetical protein